MSVWENLKGLKGLNVLNLFAGMEVGRLACERAGVPIDKYYSSEIDKYAIQVSKANWPDIIHLGDVTKVYGCTLPDIHLLLGGSPCQGFSFAGKQLNFNDPRSALLFEYVRILKELREYNPNVYFLLENVMMKKEYQDVISKLLGVQPIMINSALVSAQNRKRLYWTNIPFLGQPEDKGIVLKDILETSGTGFVINRSERSEKAMCIDANYHKGADNHGQRTMIGVTVMENGNVRPYKNDGRKGSLSEIGTISHENNKSCTHTAANTPKIIIGNVNPSGRGQSGQVYNIEGKSGTLVRGNADPMLIGEVKAFARRGRVDKNGEYGVNYEIRADEKANAMTVTNQKDTGIIVQLNPSTESGGKQPYMQNRVFDSDFKSTALTLEAGRLNVSIDKFEDGYTYRKLTVLECKRLQTVPDEYKMPVSNTQAYKMLGNGWNSETIEHLLLPLGKYSCLF